MSAKKTCRECKRAEGVVKFSKGRRLCVSCKGKQDRKTLNRPQATPPSTLPPEDFDIDEAVTPLQSAYLLASKAKEKRSIQKEHAALIEENIQLKEMLETFKGANSPPLIKHFAPSNDQAMDAIPFIVGSDWHVEEPVRPEEVQFINEYNLDIAEQRSELFYKNGLKLVQIVARDCNVDTVVLAHLGDLFSGSIHDDLVESNQLGPGDAANFVRGLVISGIDFFLKETNLKLKLVWMDGNHGRMTKQMRIQTRGSNSLELFLMRTVAERYASNPRVESHLPDGAMLFTNHFKDFNIRWIHGDNIPYGGGVGGITIPINKKIAAWDRAQQAKLTVMGHFHQLTHGGNYICNGSMIGYNPYAQSIGASPERPRQAFFTVNARHGGEMGMFAPIWLDADK